MWCYTTESLGTNWNLQVILECFEKALTFDKIIIIIIIIITIIIYYYF